MGKKNNNKNQSKKYYKPYNSVKMAKLKDINKMMSIFLLVVCAIFVISQFTTMFAMNGEFRTLNSQEVANSTGNLYSVKNFSEKLKNLNFILGVKVPVTTLCPCSKEISDNGAHNQRAIISVKVSYDENEHVWLEDLINLIESCASCPVYPLLKRQDEKFVTEHAWDNPRFVEDVLREVVVKLRNYPVIKSFEVDCEAFESIHNHSAWAYQKEG